MRIGMFTDSYFPQVSGVSTSIRTLKEELEAEGHEVIIFTTTDPKADEDEKNIIRLTSIPFLSFKDRRIAVKGMNKALREAKKQKIDIVHTHTEFSLGLTGKFVGYMLQEAERLAFRH
ncbi:MAG TPA: glycosyltransferase, partial [Trichococcus flocculiformis]|nr:glycosyltransferase [Trichococcus flocculiformis]